MAGIYLFHLVDPHAYFVIVGGPRLRVEYRKPACQVRFHNSVKKRHKSPEHRRGVLALAWDEHRQTSRK